MVRLADQPRAVCTHLSAPPVCSALHVIPIPPRIPTITHRPLFPAHATRWDRDAFKCSCKHHSDCDEAQYCALGGRCIDVAHCCEGLHDGAFIFATYRPPFDVEEGGECPASEKCCADDTDCTDGEVCDMSTHKCGENSSYVSTTAEESVASAWTAVVLGEDQLLQELLNQVTASPTRHCSARTCASASAL